MILSPIGIDDAYFHAYPPSGSLFVTNFEQLSVDDLKDEGVTVLAHPVFDFDKVLNKKIGIVGLEQNKCNWMVPQSFVKEKAKNLGLIVTTGSLFYMSEIIDLHIHSTASDGTFTPSQIIEYTKKKRS